jgi:TRAP-type uncharacterized transport system fused permease subunit
MIAPALIQVGVADFAAHMFIFYYAVLSEVSPPTALSPFAAAALTGGHPFRTTMLTWKYTAPAFLVPFMFTLSPSGTALLLKGTLPDILGATATAVIGVAALVVGLGGWLRREANLLERGLALIAGILLIATNRATDAAGLALFGLVAIIHVARTRRLPSNTAAPQP